MLSYQAIVSLPGGAAERYETRVWIKDETDRPCAPVDVFPAAEPLGLSPILDCWAVARIADALGSALEQGRKLSIFMPVSTNSILDSMFEQAVKKHLPYGHGLVLQIDEDVAERYFRQMRRFAQRMRDHGCALAISEFGGQQNSERLMRHLKPEYIKLRPDLLERMRVDDYTRKYIDAVSEEIRTLGGEAVASRVSSAQQLATLRQSRFNLIQGDLVHTPAKSMSFDFANAAQWVGADQNIA
jgi:EAL domain-containing protein (putative c-di-GMP-specific phosphodiesterase class I)